MNTSNPATDRTLLYVQGGSCRCLRPEVSHEFFKMVFHYFSAQIKGFLYANSKEYLFATLKVGL